MLGLIWSFWKNLALWSWMWNHSRLRLLGRHAAPFCAAFFWENSEDGSWSTPLCWVGKEPLFLSFLIWSKRIGRSQKSKAYCFPLVIHPIFLSSSFPFTLSSTSLPSVFLLGAFQDFRRLRRPLQAMWFLCVLVQVMAVCGGWPRSKGYGRYGAHSQGHSQGHGSWGWRSGGQFSSASSMQETLTMCLAERLLSKDRAKRRPSRSPSPLSSDGSDRCRGKTARRSALSSTERAELSELREFKAKHDAELAAKHTIEQN